MNGKKLEDEEYAEYMLGQKATTKKKTKYDELACWIYNTEKNTLMGRNAVGWAQIGAFFLIFYLLLLGIFAVLMMVFLEATVNEDAPKLTGAHNILKLSPGLGLRPLTDFQTALIRYVTSDPQTYLSHVQNIRSFIEFYEEVNIKSELGFATCNDKSKTNDKSEKSPNDVSLVCKFYPNMLGPCQKENNYGYDRQKPCVIVKINRIYGWVPDVVNSSMHPNPLLKCIGQNPPDLENFGSVHYYPNVTVNNETFGYFDQVYYPYLVQTAYRQPLVAVQFDNPKRNVVLMVKCKLYNLITQTEPLRFELLMD